MRSFTIGSVTVQGDSVTVTDEHGAYTLDTTSHTWSAA